MGEPVPYVAGGVEVSPGPRKQVKLPARVFRGRLTGLLFETNKTFLLPGSLKGIRGLSRFYDQHKGMQVLVVGHTDTVGPAASNLTLSIERAKSIAAYLTDDADFWMEFYAGRIGSSVWGVREDQAMLSELADGSVPFYSGPIDGVPSQATRDAVKKFQSLSNERRGTSLKVDGNAGQKTRKEIVLAYMQLPGTTLPTGTILATHGCGKFHLAKPTPDNTAEEENRRAEVFFFEGMVDPAPRERCPAPGCPEEPVWVQRSMHTFDLSHDPGALVVSVRDQKGSPVEKAKVHLAGPTLGDDDTDAAGKVSFKDLIPGHYTVLATKAGLQSGTAEVEVAPGQPQGKEQAPPSGAAVQLDAGDGSLGVSLVDEEKKAVPDAAFRLLDKIGKELKKDTAGADGTLKFDALPAGDYTLELNAPGFDFKSAPLTVVADIDTPVIIGLDHETGSLEVTVKDDGGALLDGAEVKVSPSSGPAPKSRKTVKGVVTFPKVRTGGCTLDASLDQFNPAKGSASISKGTTAKAAITLKAATATLAVHVVSTGPSKRKLAGVTITLTGKTGGVESTDTDGNHVFKELPLGPYELTASLAGFDDGPVQKIDAKSGQSNNVNFKLVPNVGELKVTVVDGLGNAVDDAEVRVQPPAPAQELGPLTTKDKKGALFAKVGVGACDVKVKKSGFSDGAGTVAVVGESSVPVKVALNADQMPFVVTVKTSAGGAGLEGAAVIIDGLAGTSGVTVKDGRLTIKSLAVGEYKVSASLDNHVAPLPAKVVISPAADNAFTIELKPDAITLSLTPDPLVVLVKKNLGTPARIPVALKTLGPAFKGKGRLTVSTGHLKLFDSATGGKEITPAVELDGAALTAGLQVFAEGVSASGTKDDTELSFELFVGKNAFGAKGTGKATAVELTLDLFNAPAAAGATPAALDAAARTNVGRFLHLQSAAPLRHSRALLVVREAKPDLGATLSLRVVKSGSGDVKLFDADAPGGAPVAAPFAVAPADFKVNVGAAKGVSVFLEGGAISGGLRDVFLQLGLQGGETDGDRAFVTVFQLSKIDLSVPNTKCKRTGVATAPTVKTSVLDDGPFVATDPTLLKGCGDVDLLAGVLPAATPLSWIAVQATDDAGPKALPTLTADAADAKKLKLTCDAEGSFRVVAFVDQKGDRTKRAPAESGLSFNLHLVNVEVQTGAAETKFVTTDLRTATTVGLLSISTGPNGVPAPGYGDAELVRHAFGMKTTVKLFGGGADRLRGVIQSAVAKLGLGYIQDVVADSVVGTYADGRTEKEVLATLPLPAGVVVGGAVTSGALTLLTFPVRDHRNPSQGGYRSFINSSDDSDRDPNNVTWRIRMIDTPGISVAMRHPVTRSPLASLAGTNDFHTWCCAFSQDFPENYVVVAEATWIANYGSFTPPSTWVKSGATVASGLTHHKPPIRAEDSGLEHCPPAYTDTFVMDAR